MSAAWGFAFVVGIFFATMFAILAVEVLLASLIGRGIALADDRDADTVALRAREVELNAWLEETLRSGS